MSARLTREPHSAFGLALPGFVEPVGATAAVSAREPDDVPRAVRAALGLQKAVERLATDEPDWPDSGSARTPGRRWSGTSAARSLHGFNAVGDAVNVAARLQSLAGPSQVVAAAAADNGCGTRSSAARGSAPIGCWSCFPAG